MTPERDPSNHSERDPTHGPVPGPAASPNGVIAFAGGGSGGHLSPGLAIAERLAEAWAASGRPGPAPGVLFLASDRAVDRTMLERAGVAWAALPARPPGLHPRRAIAFAAGWSRTVRAARTVLAAGGARELVSLGGFVAAPAAVAASRLGIRTTQIHLDRAPGRAGRLLARRCDRVWSACPVPDADVPVLGMPVRRTALASGPASACRQTLGLAVDRPVLLVTGASQGSRSIDRLMLALAEARPAAFTGWQVLHLAAAASIDALRAGYAAAGIDARVVGFVHEMGAAWGAASLAIARAGASTVAEIEANRVPAVFLPYPWHRDRHQELNAAPLVEAGAARCVTDRIEPAANLEEAGREIASLLENADRLGGLARAAAARDVPDAAAAIAARLVEPDDSTRSR